MPPCTCMARSAASQHSRFAQKLHIETLSESVCSTCACVSLSISHAVLRINSRSISACVASSTSGHWIAWFSASALPNGLRSRAYFTLSSMQYTAAPSELAACRIPVLMHEALRQRQAATDLAEQRIVGNEYIGKADARVIGRHIKGPHVFFDLHAFCLCRHQEAGDAPRVAVIAAGAGEQRAMGGDMHAGGPHLLAIDDPTRDAIAGHLHGAGFHVGRIRAMLGFGKAEGDAVFS